MTQTEGFKMPSALKEILAGTLAGLASKPIEFPLDTIKVRMQNDSAGIYRGSMHCFRVALKESGWRGIFSGVTAPMAGAAFENAMAFLLYFRASAMLRSLSHTPEGDLLAIWQTAAAGAFAGLGTSLVLSPVERIKCLLQYQEELIKSKGVKAVEASGEPVFRGTAHAAVATIRTRGLVGGLRHLYKGGGAMLVREIPGNAAWFGAFNFFCALFAAVGQRRDELSLGWVALAGGLGGCAYWGALFPADVVGNRIRAVGHGTMMSHARDIIRTKGIRGLYTGFWISMVRAFLANGIIFTVVDIVTKKLEPY